MYTFTLPTQWKPSVVKSATGYAMKKEDVECVSMLLIER